MDESQTPAPPKGEENDEKQTVEGEKGSAVMGHGDNGNGEGKGERGVEKHVKKHKVKKKMSRTNSKEYASNHCLLSQDQCANGMVHGTEHNDNVEITVDKVRAESPKKGGGPDEKKDMLDMLKAITDSYKTIQTRLDVVGEGVKNSANFGVQLVHNHSRNVERLFIALLLIPAFVMSTISIYRQEYKSYSFDLGESQQTEMYRIAQTNFDSWNEALVSQDADRISTLYASELTFLPTMSDQFVESTRSEDKYFMHFVQSQPAGIIVEDKVQPFGTDAYLHAGLYDFVLVGNKTTGELSTVHARFTFVWRNFDGIWKIMHHHSSQMPSAFKCGSSSHN